MNTSTPKIVVTKQVVTSNYITDRVQIELFSLKLIYCSLVTPFPVHFSLSLFTLHWFWYFLSILSLVDNITVVGYNAKEVLYRWNVNRTVVIASDMKMSQFDLRSHPSGNITNNFRKGTTATQSTPTQTLLYIITSSILWSHLIHSSLNLLPEEFFIFKNSIILSLPILSNVMWLP